jgi:AraC-like DNA-binding protein
MLASSGSWRSTICDIYVRGGATDFSLPKSQRPALVPGLDSVARVGEGQVRASPVTHLPAVLRDLGFDPDVLLAEAGFDPGLLRDPEASIPYRRTAALLAHCVERTGRPDLMLLTAQRCDFSVLGIVSLLARHSPDVGTAWRTTIKRLHLHDRGAVITLEISGAFAVLGYSIYERGVSGSDQVHLLAMALAQRIMEGLCSEPWHATEVHLPIRRPRNETPFRRFFGAPLRFNAERAALVFPSELLARPIPGADPAVRKAVAALADDLEREDTRAVGPAVRSALRAMLFAGHASEEGVATAFSMHRRTLNRRLRSEGTTFRRLLEETRFDVARQLLRDTDAAVDQIASGLGYSGPTAFGRAFKRWSGLAPQAWRGSRSAGAGARAARSLRRAPGT